MSALTAVRFVLQAYPAVTAKVGARIYPVEAPQASTLPAIVLHAVSEEDGTQLGGSDQYPVFKFIAESLGNSYSEADDVGDIVMAALRDYRGDVSGFSITSIFHDGIDFFDRGEAGDVWRRRLSFAMRYRVAELTDDPEP